LIIQESPLLAQQVKKQSSHTKWIFSMPDTSKTKSVYSTHFLDEKKPEKYRILFVDDEPFVLQAIQRTFRKEAYLIDCASNGREALEMIACQSYHLIVSDNKMPGMSGVELLARVRERYPDTIRIMLTGDADTSAMMGAVKEGAVYRFILKPWNSDELMVTVALALEQYELIQKNRRLQEDLNAQSQQSKALERLSQVSRSRLGEMLHRNGLLTQSQAQELHDLRLQQKVSVWKLLLERNWVSESTIFDVLKKETAIESVSLPKLQIDPQVTELIPGTFCERQLVLPLKMVGKRQLLLAVADPTDDELIDDLRFISGLEIQTVLARVMDIRSKISAVYGEKRDSRLIRDVVTVVSTGAELLDTIEVVIEEDENTTLEKLVRGTKDPPAIRLLNTVIVEAIHQNASDIHIQPRGEAVIVRFRVDGVLMDKIKIPRDLHPSLVSRLKALAEMDIADRRRPQDGRITIKTAQKTMDMRISIIPTITGEKVVMRLLDRNASIFKLSELGFSTTNLNRIQNLALKAQGIILATGPTGSGKTTTLYSLLQHQATNEKNYVTIEDPVEYYMDMAAQVRVHEKIGVSFASVLRSMLRQDPDVIFIGEIRDLETAEVAFHSALTGHQVYSTLHANSAMDTLARLADLGLKPYIVGTALSGVVSQRLVRRICPKCRVPIEADPQILHRLGPLFNRNDTPFFKGQGCKECRHSGYAGRAAIHELFILTDEIKALVSEGRSVVEIKKASATVNTSTLLDDALAKASSGLTTPEEILRILGSQIVE